LYKDRKVGRKEMSECFLRSEPCVFPVTSVYDLFLERGILEKTNKVSNRLNDTDHLAQCLCRKQQSSETERKHVNMIIGKY